MRKLCLAAALAATGVNAPAQPLSTTIHPAVDTVQEREALRNLSVCLAKLRPRWAQAMLSHPYLSDAQASVAAEAVSGNDTCLKKPEAEITFRTSTMVGALAEYYVRNGLPKVDKTRVSAGLATVAPLNASEDFALCVAANNPAAALDLVLSEPGSGEEAASVNALSKYVTSCTRQGEKLDVDLQSLRSLVAIALYRGIKTVPGRGG